MARKGEGNIRLSNNRGSLWGMEASGEVWDLFSAVVDCSGATPSLRIVPNAANLGHYLLTPAIYDQWVEDAVGEVATSTSVSRFRSGR